MGFDTSGPYCGAALICDGEIVAAQHEDMPRGQTEQLFPILESVLAQGGCTWSDIDAIGVGIGPGNFTGIRISVSAARGLALSLEKPAVGVSLLEALVLDQDGPRIACLSARRDRVYVMGQATAQPIVAQICNLDDLPIHWAEPGLACIGPAADDVAARLGAGTAPTHEASGSAIARIAARRYCKTSEAPKPLYLRPADAAPAKDSGLRLLDGPAP